MRNIKLDFKLIGGFSVVAAVVSIEAAVPQHCH